MQYSRKANDFIERNFEGCELKAYPDQGGVWTIGYGHTLGVYKGMTITLVQAEKLLQADLQTAVDCVNKFVTYPINQNEFDALVDFTFNLGCENFERSTLLKLLNEGQLSQTAGQFDLWDRCKGNIVAGLLRRRMAEQSLFESKVNNDKTA